jgi:hypothetical protein
MEVDMTRQILMTALPLAAALFASAPASALVAMQRRLYDSRAVGAPFMRRR